jgi:phospholipid transport system substrate-binding protein
MKQWMVTAVISVIVTMASARAGEATSPTVGAIGADVSPVCSKFYNGLTTQGMVIIKDSSKDLAKKKDDLGKLFDKSVDGEWMGKFVLGRFWKGSTPQQQKEYLDVYKQYLGKIYISKFDNDDLASFDLKLISMTKTASGDFSTKTIISRPEQATIRADYSLSEVGGECRVRDIIIENVSLLTSQRSEFQALAGKSGIDGVIAALRKKIS